MTSFILQEEAPYKKEIKGFFLGLYNVLRQPVQVLWGIYIRVFVFKKALTKLGMLEYSERKRSKKTTKETAVFDKENE